MKKIGFYCFLGVCMVVFLGPLSSLDLAGQDVNYTLMPQVPNIVKNSATPEIHRWNGLLIGTLSEIRNRTDEQLRKMLPGIIQRFSNTYLKIPTYQGEIGSPVLGWENVIYPLRDFANSCPSPIPDTVIERVEVIGTFEGYTAGPHDIDFKMTIITHLRIPQGTSDPTLRGCADHRRSCTTEDCT